MSFAVILMVLPAFAQQTKPYRAVRPTSSSAARPAVRPSSSTATTTTSSAPVSDQERRKAINKYLQTTMAAMDNGTSLTRNVTASVQPPYVVEGGDVYILTPHEHKTGPEGITNTDFFLEDNPKIFPGALLWANKKLADGDPQVVAGLGIGKVDVMLDIDTGGSQYIVKNVNNTFGEVQRAASQLVRQMFTSGYKQPGRVNSITGDYSSTEEMTIKAGVDVKFAAKFSASMSTTSSSSSISHIDDLSQVFYNVVVIPHDNDYSNLFGTDITVDDIKNAVRTNGNVPIVFVNQVSYGRRLYTIYQYDASDFKLNADMKGSYSGVSATASTDIMKNSKASSQKVYIRGGNPELGVGLIQDKATVSSVLKAAKEPLTLSKANQGIAMAYATTFIGSQQTCTRKTVGSYKTYDYERGVDHLRIIFRNRCGHVAGADMKVRLDYKCFYINKQGKKVYVDTQKGSASGYHRWVERHPDWGGTSDFNLGPWPIESDSRFAPYAAQGSRYYIEGPMRYQIRAKNHATGDWYNAQVGLITWKNGKIDIYINGSVRPGGTAPYIHSDSYSINEVF